MADEHHRDAERGADDHADHPVPSAGAVPQFRREAAHGQDEGHQDDGLHQHLGQREVRGALQREHQRDAVAGDGHHEDGQEALVGPDGGQCADHDPRAHHDLQRCVGVDEVEVSGQRLVGQHQGGERQDERHGQDDGQVEVQRTALGPPGDPDGDVVEGADGQLVGAVAVDPARDQALEPGDGVAAVEHGQAECEGDGGQPQGGGQAVPQRQVAGGGRHVRRRRARTVPRRAGSSRPPAPATGRRRW